jgi:phage gp16-like protein
MKINIKIARDVTLNDVTKLLADLEKVTSKHKALIKDTKIMP